MGLMIPEYARKSKHDIAFITADKHFRNENVLHPQLAKEVHESKFTLHFYTSQTMFTNIIPPFLASATPLSSLRYAQVFVGGKPPEPDWLDLSALGLHGTASPRISNPAVTYATRPMASSMTDYRVPGTLVVSLRLVSSEVTRVETERFALGEVAALDESGSN